MDTSEPAFAEALSAAASRAERMLETCLPPAEGGRGESDLAAAMRHAVLDGGKRPRAFLALEVAGGFGIARQGPFERLFRDARLGRIHPTNAMLTREFVAKLTLGISPDEQPRWG